MKSTRTKMHCPVIPLSLKILIALLSILMMPVSRNWKVIAMARNAEKDDGNTLKTILANPQLKTKAQPKSIQSLKCTEGDLQNLPENFWILT